jgi:hypothetical protein
MIAFFLWGYIVDDDKCAVYKSKQFLIGDTAIEERGMSSRKQVKKECARAESKQTDSAAAAPQSPFRRGTMLTQQIDIAKLQAIRSIEERQKLDNKFSMALLNIQNDFDNWMELAKLLEVKD